MVSRCCLWHIRHTSIKPSLKKEKKTSNSIWGQEDEPIFFHLVKEGTEKTHMGLLY